MVAGCGLVFFVIMVIVIWSTFSSENEAAKEVASSQTQEQQTPAT